MQHIDLASFVPRWSVLCSQLLKPRLNWWSVSMPSLSHWIEQRKLENLEKKESYFWNGKTCLIAIFLFFAVNVVFKIVFTVWYLCEENLNCPSQCWFNETYHPKISKVVVWIQHPAFSWVMFVLFLIKFYSDMIKVLLN